MARELLPLFPLNTVLFPRTHLPLHIFEDRYKLMIGEAIRDGGEFGIVLARDGGLLNTGCSAIVSKVMKEYDDGRMDILTVGRRRFEIHQLNQEKEFLRGDVQFFDDDEDANPPVKSHFEKAIRGFYACRSLDTATPQSEPDLNDPQLSFQLAQVAPDLDMRQALLGMRSEADRLKHLANFFPSYVTKETQLTHFRKIVPQNGHGKLDSK